MISRTLIGPVEEKLGIKTKLHRLTGTKADFAWQDAGRK
jgi:hypothetical protein